MARTKKITRYHTNGLPKQIGWMRDKEKVGQWVYMDTNKYGRVSSAGKYEKDLKVGSWIVYDWKRGFIYRDSYIQGKRKGRKNIARINTKTVPDLKLDDFKAILDKLS